MRILSSRGIPMPEAKGIGSPRTSSCRRLSCSDLRRQGWILSDTHKGTAAPPLMSNGLSGGELKACAWLIGRVLKDSGSCRAWAALSQNRTTAAADPGLDPKRGKRAYNKEHTQAGEKKKEEYAAACTNLTTPTSHFSLSKPSSRHSLIPSK